MCMASSVDVSDDKGKQWQKIRNENGVIVYSQVVDGADLLKIKAQIIIDVNMEKIQFYIDNLANRKKWVPYLKEVYVLKKISDTERLEYSYFSAPWPASDRDFIYRQRLLHKDNKKIVFSHGVEESALMPEQDGVVRADMIESRYTLTSLNDKKTIAELIFYADPKGWIPDWIVNKIEEVLPYKMLLNLKVQLEKIHKVNAKKSTSDISSVI